MLKEILEKTQMGIVNLDKYCWKSFGPSAWVADLSLTNDEMNSDISVVFDLFTQEVFQVTNYSRTPRTWTKPECCDAYQKECEELDVQDDHIPVSFDEVLEL